MKLDEIIEKINEILKNKTESYSDMLQVNNEKIELVDNLIAII